jgi:Mn-dependent DtxR family transcriptional regulator
VTLLAATEELKQRVLEYLATVSKAKPKEVASALKESKAVVDEAIKQLAKEGKIEFIYAGSSFVKLPGK